MGYQNHLSNIGKGIVRTYHCVGYFEKKVIEEGIVPNLDSKQFLTQIYALESLLQLLDVLV